MDLTLFDIWLATILQWDLYTLFRERQNRLPIRYDPLMVVTRKGHFIRINKATVLLNIKIINTYYQAYSKTIITIIC